MRVEALHSRRTYGELVMAALQRSPDSTAFVAADHTFSYREAAEAILRMAGVLAQRGVDKGTGVAVLSKNRPEAWFVTIAAQLIGARTSALHALGSLEDHRFICQDAEIRTLVFEPEHFEHHVEKLEGESCLEDVLSLGPSAGFADLLSLAGRAGAWEPPDEPVTEDDIASIVYTGGTTGLPKGVVRPHRCLTEMVLLQLADWPWPERPRFLASAPITHATGMMIASVLARRGTVFLHDGFEAGKWLEAVERQQINSSFLVPTMLYRILDHPDLPSANLQTLTTVYYGAAPTSPDRMAVAIERFGHVFVQFYAQAESTVIGTILDSDEHVADSPRRLASCGRPLLGASVEVHDENERPVKTGDVGEICMRGPFVMAGYWKQPEASAETLRNGWLHTGDMAVQDDEGFLTIVDRKKDMIVSGGFNVFAREVEDALMAHPHVNQAAVIGVPDPEWGEVVFAVVVPTPREDPEIADLLALVRRRKGAVHVPKKIRIVREVPLTALGKIDKRAIRDQYWAAEERQVH
jgi:fatty-acyl-CoA synthase